MSRLLIITCCAIVAVLVTASGAGAVPQGQVVLESESKLWIEGTATVNTFTCSAQTVNGQAEINGADSSQSARAEARLVVPVRQFDCGKRRMNRDLHNAMASSDHPFIRFELQDARLLEKRDGETFLLEATGSLEIAGTSRTIKLTVHASELPDGRFQAEGHQELTMSEFGIEPPTAMRGLIRAHDTIEVHFNLIARRASQAARM